MHYPALLFILLLVSVRIAAQPTFSNEKQRVISICNRNYYSQSIEQQDSIAFKYSGNRGSTFHALDFCDLFGPGYSYGFANYDYNYAFFSYLPAAAIPDPVKDLNDLNVMYDTMYKFVRVYNHLPDTDEYASVNSITYRGFLPVTMTAEQWQTDMEYDRSGRLVSIQTNDSYTPGVTYYSRQLLYDNTGKIIADTIADRYTGTSQQYTYNSEGKVTVFTEHWYIPSRMEESMARSIYGYDNTGRLDKIYMAGMNAAKEWDTSLTRSIGYDENDRVTSITDNDRLQFTAHYNAIGEADTVTRYIYGDWGINTLTGCDKTVFFYNKFHNPDSAAVYSLDRCASVQSNMCRIYYRYETYFADTLENRDEVILFPNPAHEHIYIKWNKVFSRIPVNIDIYNCMGQLVSRTQIASPAYTDAINIWGYAPGVYFLRIVNADRKQLYIGRFVVDR